MDKKIINAADGNIVVESELGKGTTFSIYMNLETEENSVRNLGSASLK